MPLFVDEEWLAGCLALAAAALLFGQACVFAVLAAKWLLIGRYRPRAAPMWTTFVWVSEAITAVYESLAVPNLLGFLRGTPLLPVYLRLFGAHIGRDVYLDTTDLTEFDCVTIGDGTVLDADCGPQTHLFEDRIMKIGLVRIGADVEVGSRCTILYDTAIGDGVRLAPLTLVAKGERLPDHTAWGGSPSAPG
jgi:non-ribosomal peptide synthetase-like protein